MGCALREGVGGITQPTHAVQNESWCIVYIKEIITRQERIEITISTGFLHSSHLWWLGSI